VPVTDRYGGVWTEAELRDLARDAARAHAIPPDGYIALIGRESAWNPNAESPAGAKGLNQFMDPTAAEWGVDPWDPVDSLSGGARYLRWLRSRTASWAGALAAYNWGIGNVSRAERPDGALDLAQLPAETREYVIALAPAFGEPIELGGSFRAGVGPLGLALAAGAAVVAWRLFG